MAELFSPEGDTDLAADGEDRFDLVTNVDRYDMITEVRKFNPFHDALGRFASKNGFSTYSANPKMRAAQPSIIRSAVYGHGKTMNVHRESKGENIGQNYDWLQTGQPYGKPVAPPAPTKPPVSKPATPKTKTPPAASSKPTADQSIADAVKNVQLSDGQKLALQARDRNGHSCDTRKIAEDYDGTRVAGKDISKSFDAQTDAHPGEKAIDAVARAQGWDKAKPTIISDRDTFDKLCLQNGCVMMRSVHDGKDGTPAATVAADTMTRSDISLGGTDHSAYGGGMYVVNTHIDPAASAKKGSSTVAQGQLASYVYGPCQMMMTLRPRAKIATPNQAKKLANEFWALPYSERSKFSDDEGAYIASKGYDGAKWHDDNNPGAYCTVFNKSALVFFSEVAEN